MFILGYFLVNNTCWSKRWGKLLRSADDTSRGLPLSETLQVRGMDQQEPNEIQQEQM